MNFNQTESRRMLADSLGRYLGEQYRGRDFKGTALVTHLHWDHVQGLPLAAQHFGARVLSAVPSPAAPLPIIRTSWSFDSVMP